MTVGEALAEARTRADLSIDDVSERSRIRQVVIHGIEQDDYEVCGGELYVRGYLRVIADALGIDAQPLIDSYDSSGQLPAVIVSARRVQEPPAPPRPARLRSVPSRLSPSRLMPPRSAPPRSGPQPVARHAAPSSARPAAPAAPPARPAAPFQTRGPASSPAVPPPEMFQPLPGVFQPPAEAFQPAPGVFQSAPEMFQPARPAERPESVAEMMRNPPEGGFPRAPAGLRETSADQPALSYGSGFRSGPGSRSRSGSGPGSGSGSGRNGAGRADRRRSASEPGPRRPTRPAGSPAGSGGGWSRAQRLIATRLTAAIVAAAVVVVAVIVVATQLVTGGSGAPASGAAAAGQGTPALPVSFDLAYGPNGVADGDNAGSAAYPVTSGATRPWSTQRYSSAEFGQHKAGTGLLLNMGGPVKVTSVTVSLGPGSGAGLQLRAGTSSAELATVASATSAGGEVTLRPGKPVTALYLLVWFTKLPRASGGQYQASVYHITVNGRP